VAFLLIEITGAVVEEGWAAAAAFFLVPLTGSLV
jgi:hypothetical protein